VRVTQNRWELHRTGESYTEQVRITQNWWELHRTGYVILTCSV
jgi:hypothetical protein